MPAKISVIVPVYNEEDHIAALIGHLTGGTAGQPHEIIIVDGNSTGNTIASVTSTGVKLITSAKGRARQMNTGARTASGEVLLFLHADTLLPPGALSLIDTALQDCSVVAGAFDLKIDSQKLVHRLIARAASLRSRLTRIPYGDQGIFIRRGYFEKLGGYRDLPLMEDVDLLARIKQQRRRITILPRAVCTSARRWDREGSIRCTLRNWLLVSFYLAGVRPERLARYYRQ